MLFGKLLTSTQQTNAQDALAALARLYGAHETLEALLQAAAQIAVEILEVEHCGIAWLENDRANFRVRAGFSKNGVNGRADRANRLIASLIQQTKDQNHGNGIGNDRFENSHKENATVAPLRVNAKVVGYLFAINGEKCPTADESLFAALGEHVGRAIEVQGMRQRLASSYLAKTLSPDEEKNAVEQNTLESHILAAVEDPEKVARIIARTFYRDLRKAGFETKQIMVVATELIGNLTEALQKTRAKSEMRTASLTIE
jgi:hypothetical protein